MTTRVEHAFLELDGQKYYNYTLLLLGHAYGRGDIAHTTLVVNRAVRDKLKTLDGLLDPVPRPPKRTSIHLVSGSVIAVEDVRKNYILKRDADAGDYNVFSPLTRGSLKRFSPAVIALFPSYNLIVAGKDTITAAQALAEAKAENPDIVAADLDYRQVKADSLDCFNVSTAYADLLAGKLKKPCISYTQLDLNAPNELTVDVLTLVYNTGKLWEYDNEDRKNFLIQVNVLNQHNWREYPGTVSMLFGSMLKYAGVANSVASHISSCSKTVKEIMSCTNRPFAGEKDFNLARDFVNSLLNFGGCRYTTLEQLEEKLHSIRLSRQYFSMLYNDMVRITPKTFTDVQKD